MRNFVQLGEVVTISAPAGGVNSGDPVLISALFGVATKSAPAGSPVELSMEGVFDLPKHSGDAFVIGDKVYFDATNKVVTSTAAGHAWVAVALAAAVGSATLARVRLNEVAIL